MSPVQSWAQTITIAAVLVAALIYQTRNLDRRVDDFRAEVNHRFDDLKDWIRSEVRRVESRIERLEHPAVK